MEIADIITEFGAYYERRPENRARLVKQLNRAGLTETMLRTIVTDDTIWRGAESQFSRVVQPFQKAWTPLNPLSFKPVAIEMFEMKVDLDEFPHQLEATYLGFLTGDEVDPKDWPFIRWYMEVHLIPQIKEDVEMNEIWAGVYAAPTPGTAGAAGTAMNGLKTVINGHIDSGAMTPIVMGAIPTTSNKDVYEYFEEFADGIDKRYWKIPMKIGCSESIARKAIRGKREKYGKDTDFTGTTTKIEDTNLEFLGLPSMDGSNKIWCTSIENTAVLKKKSQNMERFKLESIKRILSIYSDWWMGVGFPIPQIVFTNDQDLTPAP